MADQRKGKQSPSDEAAEGGAGQAGERQRCPRRRFGGTRRWQRPRLRGVEGGELPRKVLAVFLHGAVSVMGSGETYVCSVSEVASVVLFGCVFCFASTLKSRFFSSGALLDPTEYVDMNGVMFTVQGSQPRVFWSWRSQVSQPWQPSRQCRRRSRNETKRNETTILQIVLQS